MVLCEGCARLLAKRLFDILPQYVLIDVSVGLISMQIILVVLAIVAFCSLRNKPTEPLAPPECSYLSDDGEIGAKTA